MAISYLFIHLGPMMIHKKFQVILIKNEGVTAFFVISHFHKILKFQKLLVCVGIYGYVLVCMGMFWILMYLNDYPFGLVWFYFVKLIF